MEGRYLFDGQMDREMPPNYYITAEFTDEGEAKHFAVAMNAQASRIERLEKALDMCQFQMNTLPSQEVLMQKLGWSEGQCKNFLAAHEQADKVLAE